MRLGMVDDHALFSDGVRAWLHEHAPDITVVIATGEVGKAVALGSHLDVVLLDIDLGPAAPPLTTSVRHLVDAGTRVLVVSALVQPRLVRQAVSAGALGYMSKKETGETLLTALRTVAGDELFLTPDLAAILVEDADDAPTLSAQEMKVLRLYAAGLTLDSVARRLGLSPGTAREYLERVKRKYEQVGRVARTRTEMTQVAAEDGILPLVAYRPAEADDSADARGSRR